jgi:hypothetical protein
LPIAALAGAVHRAAEHARRSRAAAERSILTIARGALGPFGDDDLVGAELDAGAAALGIGRPSAAGAPIHDDAEATSAPEGCRQEIEELGVASRHDDPVASHPVRHYRRVPPPSAEWNRVIRGRRFEKLREGSLQQRPQRAEM